MVESVVEQNSLIVISWHDIIISWHDTIIS